MNKKLEEAVKILKEIQETNRAWLKKTKDENCEKLYLRDIEAIETILKELKRLQEENKNLKKANREKADKLIEITDLYLNSIAKSKIIEKIEELTNTKGDFATYIATSERIKVLKELLEEK